jgi:hypothetical protein
MNIPGDVVALRQTGKMLWRFNTIPAAEKTALRPGSRQTQRSGRSLAD